MYHVVDSKGLQTTLLYEACTGSEGLRYSRLLWVAVDHCDRLYFLIERKARALACY